MKKKIVLAGLLVLVMAIGALHMVRAEEDHENDNRNHKEKAHAVGSTLEVHFFDDGKVLVRGAKVTAVSGNTISATTAWGSAALNWTVNVATDAEIIRKSGGRSDMSEISIGDFLSFNGNLVTTASTLTVNAKIVKDWSVQKKKASITGRVESADASTTSFMVKNEEQGGVKVVTNASTTITKGTSTVSFAEIKVGDKVHAEGVLNTQTKVLTASKIKIYVDKTVERHVFEGMLVSVASTTVPTSLMLKLESGDEVTVNVPAGISIVGKAYLTVSLSAFQAGDKVRVWGTREGNTIDATVVRNTNLPR